MADPQAPLEGYAVFRERMEKLERRLAALESPTGTQIANVVLNLPVPGSGSVFTKAFALNQFTPVVVASVTVTCPTGKQNASILAVGRGQLHGSGGGNCWLRINGVDGQAVGMSGEVLGAGTQVYAGQPMAASSGPMPASFTIDLVISADDPHAAGDNATTAQLAYSVVFKQ